MSFAAAGLGALLGALAGIAVWRWLRAGSYRVDGDRPRLALRWSWLAVPASAGAGALAAAQGWSALTPAAWLYLVGGVLLGWIDLDVHRLPDRVLKVWAPTVAAAIAVAAGVAGRWELLTGAVAGAAVMTGLYLVLALAGSMGLGDVKVAAVTGTLLGAYGWTAVLTGAAAGFVVAAAAGVVLLARGHDRNAHLAFGPAIVAGGAAAFLHTTEWL